ncbi:hypothetical protein Psyc_1603 [Psychrobacter arcticus 273-4]|uniref:Uncharacterized protein n=1 Tax=Psychrobacter arcticus (strain DSM 17307 / VKM B-2377 / 273-4) TaxID=259536 RepID=Q4FRA7_PSYA2|nr:hypothetical protein [Psychrobacter arcticus]AAZ19451.1 hypothetical protein Psyc_1603 [Psychrobacter arcticus 273-4]
MDNNHERYLGSSKKPIVKTDEKIPNKSLKTIDISPIYSIKSETISNQNLQENNNKLEKKRIINMAPDSFFDDNLENIKGDDHLYSLLRIHSL